MCNTNRAPTDSNPPYLKLVSSSPPQNPDPPHEIRPVCSASRESLIHSCDGLDRVSLLLASWLPLVSLLRRNSVSCPRHCLQGNLKAKLLPNRVRVCFVDFKNVRGSWGWHNGGADAGEFEGMFRCGTLLVALEQNWRGQVRTLFPQPKKLERPIFAAAPSESSALCL